MARLLITDAEGLGIFRTLSLFTKQGVGPQLFSDLGEVTDMRKGNGTSLQ